jgi:permease for cytosine/purines
VVFGAFAILFGLNFWQTVTSMAVGIAIGTLGVLPTAVIGPRTGTNMTVSSGAFFGIRSRFIGSGLALAIALAFAAVTVWTSGDAIVAAGHRLLGTPESDIVHGVAYAAVAALMVTVALYGHATIVAIQKIVVPVVGGLMVVGVFAFAGSFDPSTSGGEYALGGFWQTWALSAVLFAAAPISYGSTIGDYLTADLVNPVQRQADLHRTRCGHVHGCAAAQPVRCVHRADVGERSRLLHRLSRRGLPCLVRPADRGDLVVRRHEPRRAVRLRQRPRPGRTGAAG